MSSLRTQSLSLFPPYAPPLYCAGLSTPTTSNDFFSQLLRCVGRFGLLGLLAAKASGALRRYKRQMYFPPGPPAPGLYQVPIQLVSRRRTLPFQLN